jgi:beta-glucosidase
MLFHEEALHGYVARDATSFPQAIALASTWDPALVERNLQRRLARDAPARRPARARSGRRRPPATRAGAGSRRPTARIPISVSEMSLAAIRGFQGTSRPLAPGRVFVTLKHMTGHGQPESGTNIGPAPLRGEDAAREFLPAVRARGARAHAGA